MEAVKVAGADPAVDPEQTTPEPKLTPYPMDNDNPHSRTQHTALTAMLDPVTTSRIDGLLDLAGARCLEIGAGAGSIAVWLADRVGPTGSVLATDIKPHQIPQRDNLTVLRHDLVEEPLPEGPFDLIHARLVLGHLPQRQEILGRLVQALAEGGVLLIEDWHSAETGKVLTAPSAEAAELFATYQTTIGEKVFTAHGTDRTWATRIHTTMVEAGLDDVHTTVNGQSWKGGSPGSWLMASNLDHMRDKLLAAGLTETQLAELHPLLNDPRLTVSGHLLYSTSGWRRNT